MALDQLYPRNQRLVAQTRATRKSNQVWMTAAVIFIYYKFHKYYFWHKHSVRWLEAMDEEESRKHAASEKRGWGFYRTRYRPTLEISRKAEMYRELGGAVFVLFVF